MTAIVIYVWISVFCTAVLLHIFCREDHEFTEGMSFVRGLHRLHVSEPIIRLAIQRDCEATESFKQGAEEAFRTLREIR